MANADDLIDEVGRKWQTTLRQSMLWLLLWCPLVFSTLLNARLQWRLQEPAPEWIARIVGPMIALGLVFGYFAFRMWLRVVRGPRNPSKKSYARLFGAMLAAMLLAWSLHVFGMVCMFSGAPYIPMLLMFFVPAWALFLLNVPTRTKLLRWTSSTSTNA